MATVAVGDERRHPRGTEAWWGESWYFDFAAPDGALGGFVRLGLYPNQGVAWYWAALVGQGRRLVLVRDHDLEPPGGRDIEIRGQGIWSAVNCETPLDHWSIGLEAFAVALDDPTEAYRGERGDLVGLGFDLEWEALAPAFGPIGLAGPGAGAAGYGQACRVTGEILVGDEQLDFDGTGHRGHNWGVQDWWTAPRSVASGIAADGAAFAVGSEAGAPAVGFQSLGGGEPEQLETAGLDVTGRHDGLPASAAVTLGGRVLAAGIVASAPLLLEGPDGRTSRLARALCLYRSRDGQMSTGWADWLTTGAPARG